MNTDQLIACPKCGSDACHKLPINETAFSYFDWGCGYHTNDLLKEGEFDIEAYEEALPELHRDLKYVDSEKRVWYPLTINLEGRGTVFANGTSKDNWQWSAIKSIPLTEDEKIDPKYKGKFHKSDARSLKHFGTDFIEGVDYIGMFNQN